MLAGPVPTYSMAVGRILTTTFCDAGPETLHGRGRICPRPTTSPPAPDRHFCHTLEPWLPIDRCRIRSA